MNGERTHLSGTHQSKKALINFSSDSYHISTSAETLNAFLSEPSNLIEILPQDRIEDWKTEGETCSFKIKGLSHISLKLALRTPSSVVYENTSSKPFPFKLNIYTSAMSNMVDLSASFDADVNSFMKMMLQKPLTNFLNSLGETIQKKYA